MKNFSFNLSTTLYLVGSCIGISGCQKAPEKSQPNILYIFTDDQSFKTVSCYPEAYDWVKTPNIDRLAREGMRFSSCYTGTWSMASRATALTGLHTHGIQSLRMAGPYPQCEYDPEQCPFWPSTFRKAGYYTGIIGKWHTGSDDGAGRDWDYSAVWNHTLPKVYGNYYLNQKISFNGAPPVEVGGYSTDNYTKYAIDFITKRSSNKKQPWYLWLCYDATHSPYTPADRHKNEYLKTRAVPVPEDIFPPRPTKPEHMINYGTWIKNDDGYPEYSGVGFDDFIRKYNRAVLALDEGVGQILKVLEETGQLENTLIIYTSDQGFAIGQHGFTWKYAPYDATLKAPLLIRWPGKVIPGAICDHPVGGHDLIATFFSVAGIEIPWKMHGHDISPMFKNPDCKWDHPLMLVNTARLYGDDTNKGEYPVNGGIPCWVSLREGKMKYIRYLIENEIEELYDLGTDPEELTNLALSPEHHVLLAGFREKLINELKRTDAGFVDKMPEVKIFLDN